MLTRRRLIWVFIVTLILFDLIGLAELRGAWQSRQAEKMNKTDVRTASPSLQPATQADQGSPLPAFGYVGMVSNA